MRNVPTNFLLIELKEEREKYTRANRELMQEICDELVSRGEYPEMSGIGLSPLMMVELYGVDWHKFRGPLACQVCETDLRDLVNGTPFKLEFAQIVNDRVKQCTCPKCGNAV